MTKFNVTEPLFTLTHIRSFPTVNTTSFNDNDFYLLWSRVRECLSNGVPFVNSIQVDFFATPNFEPGLVIKKINDPTTRVPDRTAQCQLSYQRLFPANILSFNLDTSSFVNFVSSIASAPSQRTCPSGTYDDQTRDQCVYPCDSGWISDSLGTTCYSPCQEGATQDPSICSKTKDSYSRTVYAQYFKSQCDQATGKSCDGVPFTWYPKCMKGYLPSSNTCFRKLCPTDTTEINNVCVPESKPRRRDNPTCTDATFDYIPDPDIKSCFAPCMRNFQTKLVGGAKTTFCDANLKECPSGFTTCAKGCIRGDGCSELGNPKLPYPVCNIY